MKKKLKLADIQLQVGYQVMTSLRIKVSTRVWNKVMTQVWTQVNDQVN